MTKEQVAKLSSEYPFYIPVPVVAEVLQMAPEALRASISQGRCPFGFSWKLGERSGFKIPTITFLAWLTKGVPVDTLVF